MRVVELRLKEHQFRDGGFNGRIMSANDASRFQLIAGIVTTHLYIAGYTLTDVHDGYSPVGGFADKAQEPLQLRCVATAISPYDDAPELRCVYDMSEDVFLNTWE